jgi:hypothetical protein
MSKQPARHTARGRVVRASRWNRLNRGDLAILLCGVLGFLSLTFGGPLLSPPDVGNHGGSGVRAAEIAAPSVAPPSSVPMPSQPAEQASTAAPLSVAPSATPVAGPVLPDASAPLRVRYQAAAIDTEVHPLEPDAAAAASRTVVPPSTMDGYWLTPFGVPGSGSGNTTYIIGHSWEDRDAPFNHLSSRANTGDGFDVVTATGTIRYRVDSVTTYLKASLKDSPIWDMVPNRVVLISCYTEDPWGKNVVVSASPAAG